MMKASQNSVGCSDFLVFSVFFFKKENLIGTDSCAGQLCVFPNHVESVYFTAVYLLLRHRNISTIIRRKRRPTYYMKCWHWGRPLLPNHIARCQPKTHQIGHCPNMAHNCTFLFGSTAMWNNDTWMATLFPRYDPQPRDNATYQPRADQIRTHSNGSHSWLSDLPWTDSQWMTLSSLHRSHNQNKIILMSNTRLNLWLHASPQI